MDPDLSSYPDKWDLFCTIFTHCAVANCKTSFSVIQLVRTHLVRIERQKRIKRLANIVIFPYFSSDFVTLLCGKRSSPPPLSSNEVPREKKRKEKKPHKKKEVKESNRNEENDIVATTQVILLQLDHFGVLSKMSIFSCLSWRTWPKCE